MRPVHVVVFSPSFDEDLRLSQRVEDLAIEEFIVNRQPIVTPYRHPKMTPLERPGSWPDAV